MCRSLGKIEQNSSRVPQRRRLVERLDFLQPRYFSCAPAVKTSALSFFHRRVPALAALLLLFAGCGEDDPRLVYGETQYLGGVYGNQPVSSYAPVDNVSYWDGEGVPGKPSIKISLTEQRAYFYKGGQLVGISQLSTGREGLDTPTGNFKIIGKDIDHASSVYGDYVDDADNVVVPNIDRKKDPKPPGTHYKGAPMPYYMQIAPGFGLHAGYLPGYPASHGCIRMPEFMAENFFDNVDNGTPVTIAP